MGGEKESRGGERGGGGAAPLCGNESHILPLFSVFFNLEHISICSILPLYPQKKRKVLFFFNQVAFSTGETGWRGAKILL